MAGSIFWPSSKEKEHSRTQHSKGRHDEEESDPGHKVIQSGEEKEQELPPGGYRYRQAHDTFFS
jgi:hypothetical protein